MHQEANRVEEEEFESVQAGSDSDTERFEEQELQVLQAIEEEEKLERAHNEKLSLLMQEADLQSSRELEVYNKFIGSTENKRVPPELVLYSPKNKAFYKSLTLQYRFLLRKMVESESTEYTGRPDALMMDFMKKLEILNNVDYSGIHRLGKEELDKLMQGGEPDNFVAVSTFLYKASKTDREKSKSRSLVK